MRHFIGAKMALNSGIMFTVRGTIYGLAFAWLIVPPKYPDIVIVVLPPVAGGLLYVIAHIFVPGLKMPQRSLAGSAWRSFLFLMITFGAKIINDGLGRPAPFAYLLERYDMLWVNLTFLGIAWPILAGLDYLENRR